MMKMGVIVMWAMVAALVICAALWPLARHADRRGCPGLLHNAALRLRQLTLSALLALGAVSICAVAHSGKMRRPATGGTPVVPVTVTPQDLTNGWRVAEETESEPFAQPSANAVTNKRWRLRGAHDDAFRIPADGWSYPYATGITVLSRGELHTNIHAHDFPRAFGQDLSLIPLANWPMLPEGRRESLFWYAATPSNTLLATWCNAALGRDATNPVSFQAELFPDGGFAYRYEGHTLRHERVWSFDWDDDGLENSVDPDPLTPCPDAHGTNAEWYDTVCSNIVNTNAYYFVDVVAERGPAPIYFTGDRTSRLGNPVVVARAGETNRVPLLIGINYAVTSSVPIEVSVPTNSAPSGAGACYAAVTTNGVSNCAVQWPLEFGFAAVPGGGYEVEVQPFDPGGEFSWSTSGGGLNLRGGSGCSFTSVSNWIGFTCGTGGNCGCNGCSVDGAYSLERASFALPSVWCGCSAVGSGGGTNAPPSEPSVSVAFDKSVVFYEDAYTNAPNDVVAKRSTRTTLSVSAYGGASGGMLHVTAQSISKLARTEGNTIPFPYRAVVPPYSSVSLSVEYEAAEHSESTDDISVAASVISLDGSSSAMSSDTATAIQLRITSCRDFPVFVNRHVYGICEDIWCEWFPQSASINWAYSGGGRWGGIWPSRRRFLFSENACFPIITAANGNVSYNIALRSIEPNSISAEFDNYMVAKPPTTGKAGLVGMLLQLSLMPTNVNFEGLYVEEIPSVLGTHTGYFDKPAFSNWWYHTSLEGAGEWFAVGHGNVFTIDEVSMPSECPPPWTDGAIEWQIPVEWAFSPTNAIGTGTMFYNGFQKFDIDVEGTVSIEKFGHIISRGTNDVFSLKKRIE